MPRIRCFVQKAGRIGVNHKWV